MTGFISDPLLLDLGPPAMLDVFLPSCLSPFLPVHMPKCLLSSNALQASNSFLTLTVPTFAYLQIHETALLRDVSIWFRSVPLETMRPGRTEQGL
jgi:hypothetical protein